MTDVSHPAMQGPASPSAGEVAIGFFRLFGAPTAWFVELCGGFALATQACVIDGVPRMAPASLQWTGTAMALLMGIAVLIALSAALLAWRALRRAQPGGHGDERAGFLALWGVLLGGVFALATAMTAVGFLILPRCAGA